MPKYSTGSSTTARSGDTCELCGEESNTLQEAEVAGAQLLVCTSCAPHDDAENSTTGSRGNTGDDRQRDATPVTGQTTPLWEGDSERWEKEGTDYDNDQLPYLVEDYGNRVTEARVAAEVDQTVLAKELGITEENLRAIERGHAYKAETGGSVIETLEDRFGIELIDA